MRRRTKTCSRSNANKTGNDAGAETDQAELACEQVVEKDPTNTTTASGKVGVDHNVDRPKTQVGSASAVESEPSEPDKHGADAHKQRVVRLVVNRLLAIRRGGLGESGAEHHGPGEGAEAAGDVDGAGSGEIVEAELVEPSTGVPLPVCKAEMPRLVGCRVVVRRRTYM